MTKTIEKIADLEFNEIATLKLIEMNEDLTSILIGDENTTFADLYEKQATGKLNQEIKTDMVEIFEKIILTKKDLASKYSNILETSLVNKLVTTKKEKVAPKAVTKQVVPTTPKVVEKVAKETKEDKVEIPRRYGLVAVNEDIAKQGGKPTILQSAMISGNDLKNLYVNVNNRLIKDYFTKESNITDAEYRDLIKAIATIKQIVNPIIKK